MVVHLLAISTCLYGCQQDSFHCCEHAKSLQILSAGCLIYPQPCENSTSDYEHLIHSEKRYRQDFATVS
jgi:hypothetical protein